MMKKKYNYMRNYQEKAKAKLSTKDLKENICKMDSMKIFLISQIIFKSA